MNSWKNSKKPTLRSWYRLWRAVKQAGENLQNLSPTELEEDLKSVALLLNRQGNADKLIDAANSGLEQNFGAILQELIPIVDDKTDLNAVTPPKKEK